MPTATKRAPLTDTQRRMFELVVGHFAEHAAMPTFRDLVAASGYGSTNAVASILRPLVKKGWLEWDRAAGSKAKSRSLRVPGLAELLAPVIRRHAAAMLEGADRE